MEFRITIPDAIAPRLFAAIAASEGYKATLDDGRPNPQTRQQFVREFIIRILRERVLAHEQNEAAEAARRNTQSIDF